MTQGSRRRGGRVNGGQFVKIFSIFFFKLEILAVMKVTPGVEATKDPLRKGKDEMKQDLFHLTPLLVLSLSLPIYR